MIKIATWNVNSIRSRITHLTDWLKETKPDVVLLQELKCLKEHMPIEVIEELGYNVAVSGQKTYNGVAILSKYPLEDISKHFPNNPKHTEARYIEAVISVKNKALRIASIYVPNGQNIGSDSYYYKLNFLDEIFNHACQLNKNEEILILGGDYNVAPYSIDVYEPNSLDEKICFSIDERKKLRKFLNYGFVDIFRELNPKKQDFSWWDYRGGSWQHNKGMRIDLLLLSPEAADMSIKSYIEKGLRSLEKPSDHAPVIVELEI